MIYLDHAATTPLHPEVLATMNEVLANEFGNPSSIHRYGRSAHAQLEEARQTIAQSLHVQPQEIIFTSGGTESDNTAIIATALQRQHLGKHLITTIIEHHAVLEAMAHLERQGFEVTYLPVDEKGQVALSSLAEALRPDTILVSMMMANNETGNLLPIQAAGELLADHQALFHTDAVQAYGKIDIDPNALHVDLLSVSAHKINGPKGVGFLYKRTTLKNAPYLFGGEQEEKRRAGTENLAGICGMATAIRLLTPTVQAEKSATYQAFTAMITDALRAADIPYQINGDQASKLPHVLNLWLPNVPNDLLLMRLDLLGTAISTGSACTAGNVEPSHVLTAMYGPDNQATKASIRISFGLGNTREQIATFTEQLVTLSQELQQKG